MGIGVDLRGRPRTSSALPCPSLLPSFGKYVHVGGISHGGEARGLATPSNNGNVLWPNVQDENVDERDIVASSELAVEPLNLGINSNSKISTQAQTERMERAELPSFLFHGKFWYWELPAN